MTNTILKNSPADKAGLKIGNWYPLKEEMYGLKPGTLVQFTRDDGSYFPRFDAVGLDFPDNWAFVRIGNLDLTKPDRKFKVGDLVRVVKGTTRLLNGQTYTVTETLIVDRDKRVYIDFPTDPTNTGSGYNECRFELVKAVEEDTKVKVKRVGDVVSVKITGKLTKEQVQSLINNVFE